MTSRIQNAEAPSPAEPTPTKGRSNSFFRKSRVPFALEDARRQGDISQLAYLVMGGRDAAVAFLNAENEELGGRPIALATASAEGYEHVVAAIRAWKSKRRSE
ncbi:MAG TPA: antitoxin Xre/MbcA/ParS toxin-binding domain-containing protein [Sphingopyxis sp.]|nr:antitoxin Xre/MbcA/ParS toxin-binding domain-containing protein [Sphingopyxis sp.]